MKRIVCFIIVATLLFTSTSTAYAKKNNAGGQHKHPITHQQNNRIEETKQNFKIDGSPVIKYGKYKLPIMPITKGIGAIVDFDKNTAVLTVEKGTTKIIISFKDKTVTVNGVSDNKSGIFTAKNGKKTTVLIKYIANKLCVRANIDDDNISIVVPGLDLPTNVTITPVGTVVKANTLNNTTLYLTAAANIVAGQATGGRAELYVGSKLVATDTVIAATDSSVTFTTSDSTPTNAKLQAAVPVGGVVKVKLYNVSNNYVTSAIANPTLVVDYIAPTITGITSATYNAVTSQLNLNVIGAGAIGDTVDVTKISLYDNTHGITYQLKNVSGTGSNGVVASTNSLLINIGSADRLGLTGFGGTTMYLCVATGSLLNDSAGNTSPGFLAIQYVPLTMVVSTGLDAPTNVTVTPVSTAFMVNTLNSTTQYMTATANIKAGQATGGKAELYVGSRLVATDAFIGPTDSTVTFTTSDSTPNNAELQAVIPVGGVVTVKLYNNNNSSVISTVANPTLIVDYISPTITGITSAIYNVAGNQLYLIVSGAGAIGDTVDVTRISLYDSTLGRTTQLTKATGIGSNGSVGSSTSLIINLGSADKLALTNYGASSVFLTIATGSLIRDAAGNTSTSFAVNQIVAVTVIK